MPWPDLDAPRRHGEALTHAQPHPRNQESLMPCSTGCPTPGAHQSYGECLRSKGTHVAGCDSVNGRDRTKQKKWDREVDRARTLMSKGILPENTFGPALDKAERISDATGKPYRADA